MGAAAGPAAAGASLVSAGLGAYATYEKAKGVKAANEFQAAELELQAEYGRLKADQTSAQLTQKLNQTLGNIDAIRAASHTDPTSPSGVAYRDYQEEIGVTQKSITVGSILAKSRQQEADAAYLRKSGSDALLLGKIGAVGQLIGGASQAIRGT